MRYQSVKLSIVFQNNFFKMLNERGIHDNVCIYYVYLFMFFLMVLVKIHWLYLMFIWNYRVLKDF
ncbi:unknown [Clostridium sp. CAG:230]|nr:unknown [Clostridium sp. CAG:230]